MRRHRRLLAIMMAFVLFMGTVIQPAQILADSADGEISAIVDGGQGEPVSAQAEDDAVTDGGKGELVSAANEDEDESDSGDEETSETGKDEGTEEVTEPEEPEEEKSEGTEENKSDEESNSSEGSSGDDDQSIEGDSTEGTKGGEENGSEDEGEGSESGDEVDEEENQKPIISLLNVGQEISEDIITDIELTLENGEPLPDPMPHPNEKVLDLKIRYDFALENGHSYGAGSTYTFKLPDVFKVYNKVSGDLNDGSGEYGEWELFEDRTVVLTFNDEIANGSDFSGWVEFGTELKKDLTGDLDQIIKIQLKDGTTKEIPIHFEAKETALSIDKKGSVNKKYNADKIDWEIDFNKALTKIDNAVLSDPMGDNQLLVPSSIEIYELNVQLDGSALEGKKVTEDFTIETENDKFSIDFRETDKAYRVKFQADITDGEATQYENIATLTADGEELHAESTVRTTRGEPLAKRSSAYDEATQTITWEVKYNYNEKSIDKADAYLIDTFGENQKLDTLSVKVEKISIDSNSGGEAEATEIDQSEYVVEEERDADDNVIGFKLAFENNISNAYKITYKTNVVDRVESGTTIKNKITANGNTKTGSQAISQQIFNKSHRSDSTNYDEKTTKWNITINGDKHTMHDVVFTDTLPKGLTLDSSYGNEGIEIKSSGDEPKYSFIYNKDSGEITINFIDETNPLKETITITYKTKFDFNERESGKTLFKNEASLNWKEDETNKPKSMTDFATFEPNKNTQFNGSKGGSYNATTKEITWDIGVNYNYRKISEAIVEDYIKGNQNFDINTIEVHKMKIASGGGWETTGDPLTKDEDYKIDEVTNDDGDPGFKLTFNKEITTPYQISYMTDVKNQVVQKEYTNTAVLKDGDTEFPLTAKVSAGPDKDRYAKKDAAQDGDNPRILHWNVTINTAQSTISDAVLTDTPSDNQLILEESFKLFGTNVDKNGTVTKDVNNELVRGTDYTLNFKEDDNNNAFFELSFKEEIDTAYILEYDTFVIKTNDNGETNATNNAELNGTSIKKEDTSTSHTHKFKITVGAGGAESRLGGLEVTKVDAADKATSLPGAEFTLYDETGKNVIKRLTTDTDGKLTFEKLLFGNYILKETKAPKGYASGIAGEGQIITIDKDVTNDGEPNTLTIENKELNYAVKLIKQNSNHPEKKEKLLAGAEFTLYDSKSNIVEQNGAKLEGLTTNDDGEIVVNELEPGKYYFVETKAPKGYQLDSTDHEFTIEVDQTEVVEVIVGNEPNSFTLEKVRTGTNIKLPGAEFKVFKKDGDEPVKHTVQGQETDTFVTNSDGEIIIEDLDAGDYYVVETKAPAGYRLNSTPIDFTVEDDKPTFVLAENRRRSSGGGGGGGTPPTPPVDPEKPDPEDPKDPEDPDNPDPEKPTDPIKPNPKPNPDPDPDPEDPTDPEDPDRPDPEDPKDPNKPDPEDPTDPGGEDGTDPEDPSGGGVDGDGDKSDDPDTSGKPNTPGSGGGGGNVDGDGDKAEGNNAGQQKGDDTNRLPDTATNMFNYGLVGAILLLIGLAVRRRTKKA